ncbi:MAG: hypothetical protein JXQ99_16465 [Hyphomicrobiaceae bacterium]
MRRRHLTTILVLLITHTSSANAVPRTADRQAVDGQRNSINKVVVIGKDTRRRVPKRLRSATRGVGQLYDSSIRGRCTAFCVAKNAVITNSHCIAWRVKGRRRLKRNMRHMSFRLGRKSTRLKWQNIKPIGNPYLSTLSNWPGKTPIDNSSGDWTVARLAKPICAGKALKLANNDLVKAIAEAGSLKVAMIGFHRDRSKRRLSYTSCYITNMMRNLGNGIAVHSCDSKQMSSGSPIVLESSFGLDVLAINTGWITFKSRQSFQFGDRKSKRLRRVNVAALPFELNWKLAAFLDLEFVDARTTTREIKALLKAKYYFRGKVNARVSPGLTAAIKHYQYDRNDVPLGLPSKQLLRQLKGP